MNVIGALRIWGLAVASIIVVSAAHPTDASDSGQVAVDEVSLANYIDLMDNWLYTHDGDDRGYGPEHDLAMDNIAALMASYGLTVTLEPFTYSSSTYYNVVGTKLGTLYPDQQYVIGAHYDSVSNPGADDNASGVALVLETARVLSQYPSDYTIVYIAFDREEQGLVGSTAYVADHAFDDIQAMISADMVAYDTDTDQARIYSHDTSSALMVALGAAIDEYGDGLTWFDAGWISASNHAPFDSAGFQACLLIEGEVWDNPYYHTQQDSFDTLGYLDFDYAITMTRSVVGYLVDHAGVQVVALLITLPDGVPWRVDPDVPTTIAVEITNGAETVVPGSPTLHYRFDGGTYLENPMVSLGNDLYEATLPAAPCGSAPEFYFSATGDGGTTIYHPEDAPDTVFSAVVATFTSYFNDDFETDQGWTVENVDLLSGAWERGIPAGDGDRGDPTNDFDGSGQCYLTGNEAGNSDVDGGPTRLISPTIDVGVTSDPVLKYARWFTNDDLDEDRLDVEVSNDDGASWVLIEIVPDTAGWIDREIDLAAYITPTAEVKVRFSATDNPNNSITEAAIDAVEIFELTCGAPATGDHDGDGDVDLYDYTWLQICFSGDGIVHLGGLGCELFNFDSDDDVDITDYAEFHTRLDGP
jgi:hypothetical protein